jgi:hypothetical protein
MRFKIIIVIISFLVFEGCDSILQHQSGNDVVAMVGNKKLRKSQIEMITPPNISKVDSISFVQNYIEKWIKNQLLLEKAEINLDNKIQKNIELMIDNYRTSLLLFQYQQMIIQQKLDTIVEDEQIIEYYNYNAVNFKLDSSVVKAIYIQLPKSLHSKNIVRQLIRSNKEDDIITLEDYCYQNAHNFNMGEDWEYFGSLLQKVPKRIKNRDRFLKNNRYIEATDSLYKYYVAILDYKLTNDTTPVVFVKDKIYDIIINHRKVKLIKDLENNIYNDAVDKKKFTILNK